jgi:hypothetical protein
MRTAVESCKHPETSAQLADRQLNIGQTARSFEPEVFDSILSFRTPVASFQTDDSVSLVELTHAARSLWM